MNGTQLDTLPVHDEDLTQYLPDEECFSGEKHSPAKESSSSREAAREAAAEGRASSLPRPAARLDRSLEKLGLWRATDIDGRDLQRDLHPDLHPNLSRDHDDTSGQDPSGNRPDGRRARRDSAAVPGRSGVSEVRDLSPATGIDALDRLFPDGRWPAADLVELLCDLRGVGELRLLMPILAQLTRQQARWVAWIAPPHIPYAPALAACGVDIRRVLLIHPRNERERLWAMEQALKSGTCSAVLGWPGQPLRQQDIRRLQLAASRGNTLGLLFRPEQAALDASPAPFRLVLRSAQAHDSAGADIATPLLRVKMLKRRGGWATDFVPVTLPLVIPLPSAGQNAIAAKATPPSAAAIPAAAAGSEAVQVETVQAETAQARTAPAAAGPQVETVSGLQRHLASWREAMRRPQPGEQASRGGLFSPARLIIGRRRVTQGDPAGVAKPAASGNRSSTPRGPAGHAPLHQPRRAAQEGATKPVF